MKKFKLPPNLFTLVLLIGITLFTISIGFKASFVTHNATYIDPVNLSETSYAGELELVNTADANLLYFRDGSDVYSTLNSQESLSGLSFVSTTKVENNTFLQILSIILAIYTLRAIAKAFGLVKGFNLKAVQQKQGNQMLSGMTDISSFKVPLPEKGLDSMAGLLPETQDEIHTILDIAKMTFSTNKDPQPAKAMNYIQPINGVLLYGPPGTGKTMLAKAIAKELDAGYYQLSGASLDRMLVGVGAEKLQKLFADARANAKEKTQVIFIDEIDALAKKRSATAEGSGKDDTTTQLLTEMTEIRGTNVLLIFATNFPDKLDDAFQRSERIDYKIEIPTPDMEGRRELVEFKARQFNADHLLPYAADISRKTFGSTGADINDMFNKASILAHRKGTVISIDEIDEAIERQDLGTKGRIQISGERKERVAYHEAGHALLQLNYFPDTVSVATIAPHSGSLGLVAMKGREDNMLMVRSELLNRITVTLGGAAAEITKYQDDHSAGVSGDFESARKLANAMVKELGMTLEGIKFINDEKQQNAEIIKILEHCLETGKQVINERNEAFETIAQRLLERETIRAEELNEILAT